nr:unnamed protein product [Spirometra erinaceieuropaei]
MLLIKDTLNSSSRIAVPGRLHHLARRHAKKQGSLRRLVINTEMTVVMHQPPPDAAYVTPQINVNGAHLRVVDNFTYLDITRFCNTKINDEVARRIPKACQAFDLPQNTVWKRHGLHLNTQLKMYGAVILPMLFYGEETWTMYKKQALSLNHFYLNCLQRILELRWQDRIPDTDVRIGKDGNPQPRTMLRQLQLRDKIRRLKDTLKTPLKRLQTNAANWRDLVRDRPFSRRTMKTGATIYKTNRITAFNAKREARKC